MVSKQKMEKKAGECNHHGLEDDTDNGKAGYMDSHASNQFLDMVR